MLPKCASQRLFSESSIFPSEKTQPHARRAAPCPPPVPATPRGGPPPRGALPLNPGRGVGPRPYQILTPSAARGPVSPEASWWGHNLRLLRSVSSRPDVSKKCSDVVWSPEISVQHLRAKFEIEYGTSIEGFLNSAYLAGADLNGRALSTARPLRPSVRYCEATFQGQPDCTGTVFPGTEIR